MAPEAQAPEVIEPLLNGERDLADGVRFEIAHALAKRVHALEGAIAAPAAAFLITSKKKRSPAGEALKKLVEARNSLGHGPTGPVTSGPKAEAIYDRVLVGHLRTVIDGLRFVERLPLYVVDGGSRASNPALIKFVGSEPTSVTLPERPRGVPLDEPLLVGTDGRWVALGPFMEVRSQSGGFVPRLLTAGRGTPTLKDPLTGEPVEPTEAWRDRWMDGGRIRAPAPAGGPAPELATAVAQSRQRLPQLGPALTPLEPLARGSSATVWLVEDQVGQRLVAKVLHDPLRLSESHRRRLAREVDLLDRCDHPGLVRTHGLLTDCPDGPVLLMEHVAGQDLGRRFARAPATPSQATELVCQVLDALTHLHRNRVVHRDIKPANVLLDGERAVLVDLGIARDEASDRMTVTADRLGTRRFAAPEQLSGGAVDGRADLFGAGQLLAWLVGGDAALEPRGWTLLPSGLVAVVRRATQFEPSRRYGTAAEMVEAVRRAAAEAWQGAPFGVGDTLRGWRLTSRPQVVREGVWWAAVVDAYEDPARLWFAVGGAARDLIEAGRAAGSARRMADFAEGVQLLVTSAVYALPGFEAAGGRSPAPAEPAAAPPRPSPLPRPRVVSLVSDASSTNDRLLVGASFNQGVGPAGIPGVMAKLARRRPPLCQALPDLASLGPSAVGRQIVAEAALVEAAILAAVAGRIGGQGWFAHRLDPKFDLPNPTERLTRLCARLRDEPWGAELERLVRSLVAQPDPRRTLEGLRDLLAGLLGGGADVSALIVDKANPALLMAASGSEGALRLADALPSAVPPAHHARLRHAWLQAGLYFPPITARREHGELAVGVSKSGRPLAVAIPVDTLWGPPEHKYTVRANMIWADGQRIGLIGLTDGARWRWLRRLARAGFVEIQGHPVKAGFVFR